MAQQITIKGREFQVERQEHKGRGIYVLSDRSGAYHTVRLATKEGWTDSMVLYSNDGLMNRVGNLLLTDRNGMLEVR